MLLSQEFLKELQILGENLTCMISADYPMHARPYPRVILQKSMQGRSDPANDPKYTLTLMWQQHPQN